MHPDIAYQLADQRHAELIAAVARQRLVDQAKQARRSPRPTPTRSPLVVGTWPEPSHV